MPLPTIVFAPVLEPDVRAIADELLPPRFTFRNVAVADVPAAILEADFLCGFIGPIDTPTLIEAAQAKGELPPDADPLDIADMLNALMITAVEGWVHGAYAELAPELAYRSRVLFAGIRAEHAS